MSEMDRPQPETGAERESGAGAPVPPEQQPQGAAAGEAQAPPAQSQGEARTERLPEAEAAQPYGAAPVAPRRRVRIPAMTKTWVAAVIGAILLLGGGIGGYFIGAANGNDHGRPGFGRYHGYPPGPPGYFRDGPRGPLPRQGR